MLSSIIVLLLIALTAGFVSFSLVGGAAAMLAKLLLVTSLVLALSFGWYRKRT